MTADAKLLADEIESVGKGLAIEGRSIDGGRILLPEEDALIIAALRAYVEEPQGWKLVPIEPTPEMKNAASEANRARMRKHLKQILDPGCAGWAAGIVYTAMLNASPSYISGERS